MRKLSLLLVPLVLLVLGLSACTKTEACGENNPFERTIDNPSRTGTLQVNMDDEFRSVNGPGQYFVPADHDPPGRGNHRRGQDADQGVFSVRWGDGAP